MLSAACAISSCLFHAGQDALSCSSCQPRLCQLHSLDMPRRARQPGSAWPAYPNLLILSPSMPKLSASSRAGVSGRHEKDRSRQPDISALPRRRWTPWAPPESSRPQPLQGWRCGPRKVQQRWVSRACNYPGAMIVILRVNTRPLLVGRLTFESARALGCLPRVLIPRRPIHRVITVALNLRMQIIYVSWWRCSMSTYQSIFSLPGIRKRSRLRSGSAIYYQRGVNSWQQITCKLQGSLCRLS